jgi:hypothetical protein
MESKIDFHSEMLNPLHLPQSAFDLYGRKKSVIDFEEDKYKPSGSKSKIKNPSKNPIKTKTHFPSPCKFLSKNLGLDYQMKPNTFQYNTTEDTEEVKELVNQIETVMQFFNDWQPSEKEETDNFSLINEND